MGFDEKHMPEITAQAMSFAAELSEYEKKHGVEKTLDIIYDMVKNVQQASGWDEEISCKKGCSFCCHDEINITDWEAIRILNHIEEYKPDLELLKKQNEAEDFRKLPWVDQKCSLLNKDGTCSIYENRPLICRTHNSTDDPQLCHLGENPTHGHGQIFTIPTQAITYAMVGLTGGKLHSLHDVLYRSIKAKGL